MKSLTRNTRLILTSLTLAILAACSGGGGSDSKDASSNAQKGVGDVGGSKTIKVTAITVTPSTANVGKGDFISLTATIAPENATDKSVVWVSSDTNVANVSPAGVVTAKADSGSVFITATAHDGSQISGRAAITAVPSNTMIPVTGITINPQNPKVQRGADITLTANVTPTNATDKTVKWSSSDARIINIDTNSGMISAIANTGSVLITATSQANPDITGTTTATVVAVDTSIKVASIAITPRIESLQRGQTTQLLTTVLPTIATDSAVTWSSSNSNIISINAVGLVSANADSGSAVITARAKDGSNIMDALTITAVPAKVISIAVTSQSGSSLLKNGQSMQLTATALPTFAGNKAVTWASNNAAVISVDSAGVVAAHVDTGSAIITATATDGSNVAGSIAITAIAGNDFCTAAIPCLMVAEDTAGNGTGAGWDNAMGGLQNALDEAKTRLSATTGIKPSTVRIMLKRGTYRPSKSLEGAACDTSGGYSNCTFVLQNNVEIYGGFAGTETSLTERIASASNITSLSGLHNPSPTVTDCSDIGTSRCSLNVIYNDYTAANPLTTSAVLDGVVVRNGRGNYGVGMYNNRASPTIRNVTFLKNIGYQGGGMYNTNYSSPHLTNVTFAENLATNLGGGLVNTNFSSPLFINTTFFGNYAGDLGVVMANSYSSAPLVINATFLANKEVKSGNTALNANLSLATFINTVVWDDDRGINGGILGNGVLGNGVGASFMAFSSLTKGLSADSNGNLSGVGVTTSDIFATATLADNGNAFAQTVALAPNSPAANKGALVWKSGENYYASKGSDVFKLTGTGIGKLIFGSSVPADATLVSNGGANKGSVVTPTAGPPPVFPDLGAYQH